MNIEKVTFNDISAVTGLISNKGDILTTTDGAGLAVLSVDGMDATITNNQMIIADSTVSNGIRWGTAGTIKSAYITSDRTFPDDTEGDGFTTIGYLNATKMLITVWGGGGSGGGDTTPTGGGGSSGCIVEWPLDSQQLSRLLSSSFSIVIGAGGAIGDGYNGADSTVISNDGGSVNLTGYLGQGGSSDSTFDSAGDGGKSGENIGGHPRTPGGYDNEGGFITGVWWTGWGGGSGNEAGGQGYPGSDFFGRSIGGAGAPGILDMGGGGGGFNGNGGAAAVDYDSYAESGAANSGAGGGAGEYGPGQYFGGGGGSGGCIITWW